MWRNGPLDAAAAIARNSDAAPRVFVATLFHETNAFSPIPTRGQAFREVIPHVAPRGAPTAHCRSLTGYGALIQAAEGAGAEVFASTFAFAQPSARCDDASYLALRDEILDDLRRGGPFDAALFFLHGAQMAESFDDCEGDLIARVRAIVGDRTVIGVELDLHANVSSTLVDAAEIVLACKEYPHTDFDDRARDLVRLALAAVRGETRPRTRFLPIPMLGRFYTTDPALAALNRYATGLEGTAGVQSVSLIHGFPYANMPLAGAGVLVVGDAAAPDTAESTARDLAGRFFALREESLAGVRALDDVLDEVERSLPDPNGRPFVIADYADNAGGGAGSDSTFVLEALLQRGLGDIALGMIWDPLAAGFARDAGEGALLRLRLGGKTGPEAGRPLDVTARVLRVRDDARQSGLGLDLPFGLAAALDIDGVLVVVNSERQQVFGPACFRALGIEPVGLRAVVVKSTQHFRAQFDPIARAVLYADTPGGMNAHITAARFDGVRRPIWPLDDIDFAP